MKTLDEVIKAFECCNYDDRCEDYDDRCEDCPYTGIACTVERDTDALHYLKTIETTENLYMDVERGLPSIEPEQKKGKWKITDIYDEQYGYLYECPYCKKLEWGGNYCSNCGARLE